ncbi:MAG: hypothetical protein WD075_07760 [Rhodospirillales bacterium]
MTVDNDNNAVAQPDFYRIEPNAMRITELCDALAVWRSKSRDDVLPVWGDLDFLDFDVRILPRMILLDVDLAPGYGTYRFWGTRVASFNGVDMTGRRVDGLAPERHARYSEQQYRWVVDHARPALFVACLGEKSWDRKYEAVLRMPCRSAPDRAVDRVLSVGYYDDVPQTIENFVDADIDLYNYFDQEA